MVSAIFFIYPVEPQGKFAGKIRGEIRGEIRGGKNWHRKIAGKNHGEKSRGKSNHIWAAGTLGAWAPDPPKKIIRRNVRSVGTYRRSDQESKAGSEIPINAK